MIYFAHSPKVSLSRRKLVHETCEQCNQDYYYLMVRSCERQGEAPFFILWKRVEKMTWKAAENALEEALVTDRDLVPCPKCKWINSTSIAAFKKSHGRIAHTAAMTALILSMMLIGCCFMGAALVMVGKVSLVSALIALFIALGVIGAIVVVGYAIQNRWSFNLDPNRNYPRDPTLPPCTPRAHAFCPTTLSLEDIDEDEVPMDCWSDQIVDNWIYVQDGGNYLPMICCDCLIPTFECFNLPSLLGEDRSKIAVPMCKDCTSERRKRWWKVFATSGLWSVMISGIVAGSLYISFGNHGIVGLAAVLGMMVTTCIMFELPTQIVKPVKVKTVDRQRSVRKYRFQNDAYTQKVADLNRR